MQDVATTHLDGRLVTFGSAQIDERSRMIAIAIDARRQHFPDEASYRYAPLVGREDTNRWCEETRWQVVKDYNLRDMYI